MATVDLISADVIVVGSGLAGAMTAWDLARRGLRVAILEAGPRVERHVLVKRFSEVDQLGLAAIYPNTPLAPRPVASATTDPYLSNVGPDDLRPEYLRLVGGTTWMWAGMAMRLLPADFRMRSTYGVATDWPIAYGDLEPYYLAAERHMGVGGDSDLGALMSRPYHSAPLPPTFLDRIVSDRLGPHGYSFEAMPMARNRSPFDGRPRCQGNNSCSALCPTGAQYSAYSQLAKAEASGVRVIPDAHVTAIHIDAGGAVSSLSVRHPDGSTRTAVARAYVLAANAIETPRLMLASRSEVEPEGVGNSNDMVGRHLTDHHGLAIEMLVPYPVYPGRGPEVSRAYFGEFDGPARRERSGFWIAPYNWLSLHKITDKLLLEGHAPPALDAVIEDQSRRTFKFEAHMEALPDASNRIRIDRARSDSAGMPGIVVDYTMGEYVKAGIQSARKLMERFIGLIDGAVIDRTAVFSSSMTGGTLRMGGDPRTSVVDPQCRVHGYDNLFIAGSSVFPTLGVAPPALTIAALSLRLSEAVADRMGEFER